MMMTEDGISFSPHLPTVAAREELVFDIVGGLAVAKPVACSVGTVVVVK